MPEDQQPPEDDDRVVRVLTRSVFTSIGANSPRLCLVTKTGMLDSGANCCITNRLDVLVDVCDIAPFRIGLALDGENAVHSFCTKHGLLPLPLNDGGFYYQSVFYNPDATDTILSPQAICEDSRGAFTDWSQHGGITSPTGTIRFYSSSGLDSMTIPLQRVDGLYYCNTDTLALDNTPSARREHHIKSVHCDHGVGRIRCYLHCLKDKRE